MRKGISCIYRITNLITKDFYIGCTINYKKRKQEHFLALRKNIHFSIFLQRSYNKYGFDNFIMDIIEECDKDNLCEREIYHINNMKPKYNCAKAEHYNPHAIVFSDEVKLKMKESKKKIWENKTEEEKEKVINFLRIINPSCNGIERSPEYREKISNNMKRPEYINNLCNIKKQLISEGKFTYKKVPVIQYNLEGIPIKEWESIKEAANHLGKSDTGIVNACKKRLKTSYGFIWKYKNN